MLLILLLGALLTIAIAPDTPVGRALHRWLIDAPARRLSRITRGHMLLVGLTILLSGALVWLLHDEGRMLIALGAPDVIALAAAIDLSSLLDLALVAVVAATSVRWRAVAARWRPPAAPRPRARRVRTARKALPPANDEEPRPVRAAA